MKYNVYLYYHGCVSTEIEAENENEALNLARDEVYAMSDRDFLYAAEIMEEGHDVYEA